MSKLFYTTALSLLASSAMAMSDLDDAQPPQTRSEQIVSDDENSSLASQEVGSREYLTPSLLEHEARHIYDEKKEDQKPKKIPKKFDRHFFTTAISIVKQITEEGLAGNRPKVEALSAEFTSALDSLDYKKTGKSKSKIRQKNRDMKELICRSIEEAADSSDDDVSISKCDELSTDLDKNLTAQAETIVSLRDFALSNLSGRGCTYVWADEENTTYIRECFDMLWDIYDEYRGQLPGVAQILLGDILLIATDQQENEIIGLLNNKQVSFSEKDVAALLSTINSSPLDVLSIENIEKNCIKNDPIVLHAALLKPFMQNSITAFLEEEQEDLTKIMKFMDRSFESITPEERQEITSKLNIMAIFESGLATEYAAATNYEELVQELSDKIASGEISVQEAAESLIRQLDYDGALEDEVSTCIGILDREGFQSYTWEDEVEGGSETDYSDAAEVEL